MIKNLFTRKNLIVISAAFFFAIVFVLCGIAIDASHQLLPKTNIIFKLATAFKMGNYELGMTGLACVIVMGIFLFVMACFFVFEKRYGRINKLRGRSKKMIIVYFITLIIFAGIFVGFGFIMLGVNGSFYFFAYMGQTLFITLIVYLLVGGLVLASLTIIFNLINIDKPFNFGSDEDEFIVDDEEDEKNIEETFEGPSAGEANGEGGVGGGAGGGAGGDVGGSLSASEALKLDEREKVFPGLSGIDLEYGGFKVETANTTDISLEELATRFRNYLAKEEKLYYEIDTIRFFLSGLGTSHFSILEGLSGTGKSSLPRYFAKFVNANYLMLPVQTTWRDRSSLLGYFNDFSHTYTETELLLELYRANYNPDKIHIFVLDEMNISRVEYYFADFLSVLEGPVDTWKLKLMQLPYEFIPPVNLEDGYIQIDENSWFIGTANKDDSTFQITDKVYDRAITIDFVDKNDRFEVEGEASPIELSFSSLKKLYQDALDNEALHLTEEEHENFNKLTHLIYDEFDLTFGNRIQNQMEKLVPIFVACGGTKEDALDFLLTRKVIAKLEGRFEDYVKSSLRKVLAQIEKIYGKGSFPRSTLAINKLIRRL